MRRRIDPSRAADYPANIQAILKRQAPCSAWLNQEVQEIDAEAGFARIAYEFGESHLNRYGALHGGAVACAMDDALAVAAGLFLQWGEIAPTLEMKVSYLTQASMGRHIADARVIRRGRQINFLEASLSDGSDKLIATASATIMYAPMKR